MIKKIVIAIFVVLVVVIALIAIGTSESSPSSTPTEEPQQEENLHGLSEATRMQIYREIVLCEQVADRNAMRHYHPECGSCPEFIEADMEKYLNESSDSIANCKETITSQYNITEDIYWDIVVEGIESNWPTDYQGIPDCCGPQSVSTVTFTPITITGSGSEKSAPFTITTSEWIIDWEYEPEPEYPDMAVVSFFIYPRGETAMYTEAIMPGSETSGSSYSYAGPGDYYVEVIAANVLSWEVVISPA